MVMADMTGPGIRKSAGSDIQGSSDAYSTAQSCIHQWKHGTVVGGTMENLGYSLRLKRRTKTERTVISTLVTVGEPVKTPT